jgi:hypothetical protein
MSDHNGTGQESSDTTRRAFLGAASAAAALAATGTSTATRDEATENTEEETTDPNPDQTPDHPGAVSHVSVGGFTDDPRIDIATYADDPNIAVSLGIGVLGGAVSLELSEARAEELIDRLAAALEERND